VSAAITFDFRAVDQTGNKVRGTTIAPSEAEAFRQVVAKGLIPIALEPARARLARGPGRFKARDIAHFTAQLAVLVGARVPISDGLLSIAEQEPNPRLAAVVKDLATRIESGMPLADALAAHTVVFGDVYVETIRAAEKSGSLVRVLEHVSEMMERSQDIRQHVKGALIYPICVVCVLLLGLTFLIGYVVPRFGEMFESRGVPLPALTQALMALGNSFKHWWFIYAGVIGGAAIALRTAWRSRDGRHAIDRVFHRIPVVRDMLVGLAIGRFVRVLGVSLNAGLGLIESLQLAGRASGRPMLLDDVEGVIQHVRTGGRLKDGLAAAKYFTPFTRRMINAGEETGELGRMCELIARHYERETTYISKNLATAIEPIMIVLIAGAVLVIALAIFLPMWNMTSLIH
jgi:type II secretory pathway component PulF